MLRRDEARRDGVSLGRSRQMFMGPPNTSPPIRFGFHLSSAAGEEIERTLAI